MKTLAECRSEEERLMLLLDIEPSYGWAELLMSVAIYFVLSAAAGTVIVSVIMAALG